MLRSKQNENGFTLIELMIVVAILGIITAIAFPSYSNFLRSGRIDTAQSDLKSLANEIDAIYARQLSYPPSSDDAATETDIRENLSIEWRSASTDEMFKFSVEFDNGFEIKAEGQHASLSDCTMTLNHLNDLDLSQCTNS